MAVHGRTQDPEFIRGVVDRLAIGSSLTVIAPAAEGRSWYPKPFLAPMEENQPFLDGNKRTGLAAALVFLDLNGAPVADPNGLLFQAMINLAVKRLDKLGLAALLRTLGR